MPIYKNIMVDDIKQKNILPTFFSLYIAQAIPMSFFTTALQVVMRQHEFSLTTIALLQLVKLPWILKMLWAPLVDKSCKKLKDYKRWIIYSEITYAILIFIAGSLNLVYDITLVIPLILLSLIASATQDIGTDALAIRTIKDENKALVNSVQAMGSFGGSLIGGGVLLILLNKYGWNVVSQCLSLFVLLAVLPLIFQKRMTLLPSKEKRKKARIKDLILFFTQKGIKKQVAFLALFYSGIFGIMSNMKPYMVDLGYNIEEIGFINGIIGVASAFIIGYPIGIICKKTGYKKVGSYILLFMFLTALYFILISSFNIKGIAFVMGVIAVWVSYGTANVVIYTSAMKHVRVGKEGTDFTLQIVLTHIVGIVIAMLTSMCADKLGYTLMFSVESALCIISLIYVIKWYNKD